MSSAGWVQALLGFFLLCGNMAGPTLVRLTPFALLSLHTSVQAERDDDDDDRRRERPDRERPDRERRLPPLFQSLQQELRLGYIWVVQQGNRQQALRVGLEYQGRTIATITLNPSTGQPVPHQARNTSIPTQPLIQSQLQSYLRTLKTQTAQISFGAFGLPNAGAVQFPVYWNNQLVSYVRFNPAQGQVLPDEAAIAEIRASTLKLR